MEVAGSDIGVPGAFFVMYEDDCSEVLYCYSFFGKAEFLRREGDWFGRDEYEV